MNNIIPKEKIQIDETAYRFQGGEHGDIPISFFWLFTLPGRGPDLHVHPYEEIFVMQQGQATFTIGDETLEVGGGEMVIAPANTPPQVQKLGREATANGFSPSQ